jgi:hypothetical protein
MVILPTSGNAKGYRMHVSTFDSNVSNGETRTPRCFDVVCIFNVDVPFKLYPQIGHGPTLQLDLTPKCRPHCVDTQAVPCHESLIEHRWLAGHDFLARLSKSSPRRTLLGPRLISDLTFSTDIIRVLRRTRPDG